LKLLYIHQYFKTPSEGGSLRSYYLATALVKAGFEVVMLTAHNKSCKKKCNIDGIQVIYLPVLYLNELSFKSRIVAFLKFTLLAIIESIKQRNIDLCYVMTTPLTTGFIALFNRYFLRRSYVFEVGDLWPAVPIEMNIVNGKLNRAILHGLERLFYQKAKGLVGLSDPIVSHLKSIAPNRPTTILCNISNCKEYISRSKNELSIKNYQLKNQFVISYTGTFGLANDLEKIVNWAEEIADLPIKILLIGDGAEKEKIKKLIHLKELTNLMVYDAMSKADILEIVSASDAMLVSFADYPILHTGSPNKFFDALAAGKLVITNFGGWIGELIEAHKCGIVANNASEFRSQIQSFIASEEKLSNYQSNAHKLAKAQFDLEIISSKQIKFLNSL
jgi:glycosyltransferase involved in cell wall biosynthesis